MKNYHQKCRDRISAECSKKIMNDISADHNKVLKCIEDNTMGEDIKISDNSLLKQERFKWKNSGIQFYPAITINNQTYKGNWDSESVLDAICSAFEKTPQSCFDNGYSTDWQSGGFMVGPGTLILVLLLLFSVFIIVLLIYRYRSKNQMKHEMRRQINQAVTQYFALQDVSS